MIQIGPPGTPLLSEILTEGAGGPKYTSGDSVFAATFPPGSVQPSLVPSPLDGPCPPWIAKSEILGICPPWPTPLAQTPSENTVR